MTHPTEPLHHARQRGLEDYIDRDGRFHRYYTGLDYALCGELVGRMDPALVPLCPTCVFRMDPPPPAPPWRPRQAPRVS